MTRNIDTDANTPGDQPLDLQVVEPQLQVTKTTTPTSVSLGDLVTFTIVVDHTAASTADAYDIVVTDTLPAGLAYGTGSAVPAPTSVNGQQVTFTPAALTLAQDQTTIMFQARIDLSAPVGVPLVNTVNTTYTTRPGVDPNERTGADGVGGLNDYTSSGNAQVTPTAATTIDAQKTVVDLNGGTLLPGDVLAYTVTLSASQRWNSESWRGGDGAIPGNNH